MAKGAVVEGVFAINKPYGMSSAQVIRDCQSYFNPSTLFAPLLEQEAAQRALESKGQQKRRGKMKRDIRVKMGHGGTLDPLATGVLILGVGKGTKSLNNFLHCTKTYETVVLFGASTDTYDRVGKVVKKCRYDEITRPMVEKALQGFRGKIKQMPPLFAALKMDGKPIYEYARERKPLPREIPVRDVEVVELEMVEWYEPGTHNHHWPTEEAEEVEKNLVNSVWRVAKRQAEAGVEPKKLTPEQEEQEHQALSEFEMTKKEAEERVDGLVVDKTVKKKKIPQRQPAPMMSGALGELPQTPPKGRGSDLISPPPAPGTPFPWTDKGPPAARLRITATSGFYVRSLCHDLGEKLDCGGMMAELVRTRQGDFKLGGELCFEYNDLQKGEGVWAPQVERILRHWTDKPRGVVHNDAVVESQPRKRSLDVEDANPPKRAKKNSSSPESTPVKPSIEQDEETKTSPRKSKKSVSPKSPKSNHVKHSIEKDEEKSPKRVKKDHHSPEVNGIKPSIEDVSQLQTQDVAQETASAKGEYVAEVVEADAVEPSIEEEWNGIEDEEPTTSKE